MIKEKTKRTTQKQFELFKKEFKMWQRRLGLTHYRIDFFLTDLPESNAVIEVRHLSKTATVSLCKDVPCCALEQFNIKRLARHEAFHLLISRLTWLGSCRFVNGEDLPEEDEAIVQRLDHMCDQFGL